MIKNFYISNIIKYNLSNIFKVVAYTEYMYKLCKRQNIPVDKLDKYIEEDNSSYKINSPNFIKKTRLKHPIIYKYLCKYKYLLFLDADVYFFVNPLTLADYFDSECDIMMPCDNKECSILNYGFLLLRRNKKSLKYISDLINIERNCKTFTWDYGEQGIANRYIKNNSYIKVQRMIIDKFMDGKNFFNYYSFHFYNKNTSLLGFHNDFTIGITSKLYRLKELSLYNYDDEIQEIMNYKYFYYNGSCSKNISITIKLLTYLLLLCKKYNRTFILPQFECDKRRKCTFVELFNIECFIKSNIRFVENISFYLMIL